jgi:alkaline phosphatase D
VKTRYDRTIYEVARIPDGSKVGNFHIPADRRGLSRRLQGLSRRSRPAGRARALAVRRIWDNHEFSWQGRQSIVQAGGEPQPGQTVKVAANQAWFEYIPARVSPPPSGSLAEFGPVAVKNVKIDKWDENGLGLEPNNLTAINSLIAYRALRYGRHLDLIITDQHSFAATTRAMPRARKDLRSDDSTDVLRGGDDRARRGPRLQRRQSAGRTPASTMRAFPIRARTNRRDDPRREQKAWFKDQLRKSTATWKIWGNSLGALDSAPTRRTCPPGWSSKMAADTFAQRRQGGDYGSAYAERARSTTSSATRRSPASRSFRATATASGPAMPPPTSAAASSSRSA